MTVLCDYFIMYIIEEQNLANPNLLGLFLEGCSILSDLFTIFVINYITDLPAALEHTFYYTKVFVHPVLKFR